MTAANDESPPPALDRRRLFASLKGVAGIALVLALALLAYRFVFAEPTASAFGSWGASSSDGFVEIDTPEVYTRERLVNDRFIEDSWLKSLLTSPRTTAPSIAISESNSRAARVNAALPPEAPAADGEQGEGGGAGEGGASGNSSDGGSTPDSVLDNILAFKAEQLYRETIRRAIIENQLDDTHDLEGNSLYLFKFDAAVLPVGANTRQLRIDMELLNRSRLHEPFAMADFVQRRVRPIPVISEAAAIYDSWMQSANSKLVRLESDLWLAFKRGTVGDDFAEELKSNFHNRFGLTLHGDTSRQDSFRRALGTLRDEIMRQVELRRQQLRPPVQGAPGGEPETDGGACSNVGSTLTLQAPPPAADSATVDPAASGGDAADDTLDQVAHCIAESVVVNWAIRLNFGSPGSFGTRSVWDYLTPIYRPDGGLEFGPRIDYFLIAYPSLVEKCQADEECQQILSSYRNVGVLDLSDPGNKALRNAFAEAGKQDNCSHLQDQGGPAGLLLIYALAQQGSTGLIGTSNVSAIPSEGLLEIMRSGGYYCSPQGVGLQGFYVSFERGLYDFMERIRERTRSYSYSVTPREDLQLVAREAAGDQAFDASAKAPGASGEVRERRERVAKAIESEATIVGFGATRNVASREDDVDRGSVKFGWVIWPALRVGAGGPIEQQVPMQKSLSALVSIPAWWKQVHICGRYEWLDGKRSDRPRPLSGSLCKATDGDDESKDDAAAGASAAATSGAAANAEADDTAFEYDVALPSEISMLDPVLFGRSRLADPRMFEWVMGDIQLRICEPASIIIPGQRLWRSAVVTVGSQPADEIIVLPNMEGIIAKFKHIDFPDGAGTPEASRSGGDPASADQSRSVALTVWTSEGSVQYNRNVLLTPPLKLDGTPSGATSCPAAKAEQVARAPAPDGGQ